MALTIDAITIDSRDPRPLAEWWAAQLGGRITSDDGQFVVVALPAGPAVTVQRVEDVTPGKNRLHLDLGAPDREAEVERLVAAGASLVAEHSLAGGFTWTVLADPDGNQFCVAASD
ncbi:MAG: hypothetical protein KQH57_07030 [Actinomycetales bacterium]|nr:hypothetical protein [Actinomycetales bacterium]